MAKLCINCGKEWPDEFTICPLCAGCLQLKSIDGGNESFNVNLGEANAICGGVNLADSHNVDSHNVHTEDSHEIHNTWITNQERQKSAEEIRAENENIFRNVVRAAYEDGKISEDEHRLVLKKISELGIDTKRARSIIREEQDLSRRRVKGRNLLESEYALLKAVQSSIRANDREGLAELLDDLERINARVDNGEIQFFYYMLMAAFRPEEFFQASENDSLGVDCFWRTFWLTVATRSLGHKRSNNLDYKFHSFIDTPEDQFPGNIELALCLDYLFESLAAKTRLKSEYLVELSREKYIKYQNNHQPFLEELGSVAYSLLNETSVQEGSMFFAESFFPAYMEAIRIEQQKKAAQFDLFSPLTEIPPVPKVGHFE